MAVAVESSGTRAATVGTEHTEASPTTAKTRQFVVDCNAMVAGDELEIRIKRKVLTAGTVRLVRLVTLVGAQAEPIFVGLPYAQPFGGEFSLKQTTGTGRSFPWSCETLD